MTLLLKVDVSYSTRVRKIDDVEIRIEYRSKKVTDIVMVKDYLDSEAQIEKKVNKVYTFLFNFYVRTKQVDRANRLLDKLLVKALQTFK